jgi:hypothetical protein
MSKTITRLYDDYAHAAAAVVALERLGVPRSEIGIVASNLDGAHSEHAAAADYTLRDEGTGALIGGAGGLLVGLGLLTIPGIGPVIAAGWLATTLAGAIAGGITGELIGLLQTAGAHRHEAHIFWEGVRRGGSLVSARVNGEQLGEAETILGGREVVHTVERGASYLAGGWDEFKASDRAWTSDQVREERARRSVAAVVL